MLRFILIGFLAITGFTACNPLSTLPGGPKGTEPVARIAFATFMATKSADGTCTIKLIEWQVVTGKTKPDSGRAPLHPVEVTLLDANHRTLHQFQIENPLIEDLEYANDKGILQRLIHTKDSASFFLRFNYLKETEFLHFSSENPSPPVINTTLSIIN
jgi:hypothetical protein